MLASLARLGNISKACEVAGISRATHYLWSREDPEYVKAVDDAMETAADVLEEEARRRAHDGVEEPVFYQGEVCGTVRKYSDTLLIFLLKAAKPQKFRENIDLTSKDKRIEFTFKLDSSVARAGDGD